MLKNATTLGLGALFVGLLALATAPQARADLIQNGSFEDIGNNTLNQGNNTWGVFAQIPGWIAVTGTAGIEVQQNAAGAAYDGNRHVELDSDFGTNDINNSGMYQTLTTEANQYYLVEFWFSPRPNRPGTTNGIKVYWDVDPGSLPATENYSITADGGNQTLWSYQSFTVQATGTSTNLVFFADGTDDSFGGYIDLVSVTAVPEPSTFALGGLAIAGLAAFGWRRRRLNRLV